MKKKNKLWCIFTIILAMALLLPCFTLAAFAENVATAAYIPKDKLFRDEEEDLNYQVYQVLCLRSVSAKTNTSGSLEAPYSETFARLESWCGTNVRFGCKWENKASYEPYEYDQSPADISSLSYYYITVNAGTDWYSTGDSSCSGRQAKNIYRHSVVGGALVPSDVLVSIMGRGEMKNVTTNTSPVTLSIRKFPDVDFRIEWE